MYDTVHNDTAKYLHYTGPGLFVCLTLPLRPAIDGFTRRCYGRQAVRVAIYSRAALSSCFRYFLCPPFARIWVDGKKAKTSAASG